MQHNYYGFILSNLPDQKFAFMPIYAIKNIVPFVNLHILLIRHILNECHNAIYRNMYARRHR